MNEMDISGIGFWQKVVLFFSIKRHLLCYPLFAAAFIPLIFAAVDDYDPNMSFIESDLGAFLVMLVICCSYLMLMLYLVHRRINFLKKGKLIWCDVKADANTEKYVRGFRKAYRMVGVYQVNQVQYPFITGLVTEVEFEKSYSVPVIYDPERPRKFKVMTELPQTVVRALELKNNWE